MSANGPSVTGVATGSGGTNGSSPEPRLPKSAELPDRRRRGVPSDRKLLALTVFTPVALLLLWEISSRTGVLDARFFPPPSTVLAEAGRRFQNVELLQPLLNNTAITGRRVGIGFALGGALGMLVGIAMGLSVHVRAALRALVYGTYPTPKLAIFPLLIVLLGLGESSKIAMIALGTFYMVCINTVSGIVHASEMYHEVGRAFKIPPMVQLRRIVLPSAMPSIIAGIKLGIGQALILVISVEFVASADGLGYFIWNSWQVLDITGMFMGLTIVAVAGAAIVMGGERAEKRVLHWTHR